MRNPGCWANVLDDCKGRLTGEHTLCVAVWRGANGINNRQAKLGRSVVISSPENRKGETKTVRQMTRPILCDRHNNVTNDMDTEAGHLADSIDRYFETSKARARAPDLQWNLRSYPVNGALVERWFLKSAVNVAFGHELPIGGPDAAPGWPTRELVEMVFGRRPVVRPAGLFNLSVVGAMLDLEIEEFGFYSFNNGTHVEGSLIMFRTLCFGVSFGGLSLPHDLFDRHLPALKGARPLQPLNAINSLSNVEVRFRY